MMGGVNEIYVQESQVESSNDESTSSVAGGEDSPTEFPKAHGIPKERPGRQHKKMRARSGDCVDRRPRMPLSKEALG